MEENRESFENEVKEEKREMNVADSEADWSGSGSSEHHHHHHHHHHSRKYYKRRRRKKKLKKVLIGVGIGLLALIIIFVSIALTMYNRGKSSLMPGESEITAPADVTVGQRGQYVIYNGQRYNYNKNIVTAVFLGVDKYDSGDENSADGTIRRADYIAVCALDKSKNKMTIINVPGNIICDVKSSSANTSGGTEKLQVSDVYSQGDGSDTSCIYTADAVSRIFYNQSFGMYFAMDLKGVPELTDAVDGVTVVSPETIKSFVKGEKYYLAGTLAGAFVSERAQEGADADLLRNERQNEYFKAFMSKFMSQTKKDISTPSKLYKASEPYSVTNLDAEKIMYLMTEIVMNSEKEIDYKTVPVEVKQVDNKTETRVNEKEFYDQFINIFYNLSEEK